MKKKILFICPYPINTAPGQRLKYEQYFDYFKKNNYNYDVESFFNYKEYNILYTKGNLFKKIFAVIKGYLRRLYTSFKLKNYDLIYVFLNVTPLGGSFFERVYRFLSKKMIFDIDDLVYLNKYQKENKLAKYLRSSNKYFYLMKHSDHVITCTSYLDSVAKKFNKNTTNISSTVNTKIYTPKKFNRSKKIVIGWTGSFSTLPYLNLIKKVIIKIQKVYNCDLHIISSKKKKLDFKNYKSIIWKSKTEVDDLKAIDIGLYPLPKEEWVKGKSGLKAIQFMSLGIPVIATDTQINRKVILNNKTGILVNSEKEWFSALKKIIENKKLREYMSKNGIYHVRKNFSVEVNKHKYLNILNNLMNNN
jgi:L-malate glycosyltransferase